MKTKTSNPCGEGQTWDTGALAWRVCDRRSLQDGRALGASTATLRDNLPAGFFFSFFGRTALRLI